MTLVVAEGICEKIWDDTKGQAFVNLWGDVHLINRRCVLHGR